MKQRESERGGPTHGNRVRRGLGTVGAVLLLMLLNGCASVTGSAGADLGHYNVVTGYPAVGGPL